MAGSLNELRQNVAIAIRALAMKGCVFDLVGHVSVRIPGTDEMFIRCRGGNERGLLYTDIHQIRRVNFSQQGGSRVDGFFVPLEVLIHGEIYKARPEVNAIVHAHPYASLVCGIAGLEFRPIVGAYDPAILAIAAGGVPVYPRSVLINSVTLASEFMAVMGTKNCCLMKGHGITTVSSSVEGATLLALRFEKLAQITLDVSRWGKSTDIPAEDLTFFADSIEKGVSVFVPELDKWTWIHLVQLLRDSVGIPEDLDTV